MAGAPLPPGRPTGQGSIAPQGIDQPETLTDRIEFTVGKRLQDVAEYAAARDHLVNGRAYQDQHTAVASCLGGNGMTARLELVQAGEPARVWQVPSSMQTPAACSRHRSFPEFALNLLINDPHKLELSLIEKIADAAFPCVGAKSALARSLLRVVPCHSLVSAWDDVKIHRELLDWAAEYRREPSGLRSLAAVFEGPVDLDEAEFEAAMWQRIQSFADKDHWLGQSYDDRVSADPDDPHFSLSFGGEAFFVVGLHPGASRPARRAPHPTLVFNLHDQFARLREQDRYERMRETILERDANLAGSINPMLARHGETSEARQYSGRLTDDNWQCPFRDKRAR